MKMEKSEQNFVKKKKKLTKGQASLPEKKNVSVDNGSQAEVKIEKKSKKVDVIVIDIDGESLDESEQKEKTKKRKIVTESLNGSCVKNGNDKEVKKKKKLEIAPLSSVKEKVEEKPRKVNKIQNKSVQTKPQNVKIQKEQKEELPKRAKKRKTILVVNTEKSEEQVKEKKKQESCEGITITKKRKSAKVTENGVKLGTPERDTERVKKEANAKEEQNKLATPQMKGNNKRSKAASGQKVEKDDMPNKKRDKSTKSENVIMDEEEPKTKPKPKTELKTNGKKEKGRKASVKVSKVEEKEPKKKKKGKSTGEEEEEPLILKCEEVEEQISKTGAAGKKSKKRKSSAKVETVSFGTGAKKRKIKEEVEDQHDSHLVDVVFLSEKTGNTDEVTINQGLGQWGSAQFDSSDQQQKFLRLMGGFKKGSQPAAASSDGANMALGKDAQQQLQQGLLGDFERAQSRRMDFSNRGSGLGFNAPTNKKLSIDINACRSVRFDD
ncbi:uncharacterized protein knop1 isoform X2 [Anarhichas minor]|uniref:uncharacterized protein knop1 isoform X2 n=1 Tax=Anarhichas minor TaxID=65739 RepID=UPI003F732A82